MCLLYLTALLANLPNVVLAAIVLVAVKGLINVKEMRHVWRVSRYEFFVSMIAFAAVLLLGIPNGVIVAVVAAAHAAVRDILRAEGLDETVGYFGRRISVADAIDEFWGRRVPAPA